MRKPEKEEAIEETAPLDGEVPVIRWNNRRKMAWRAFWILISFTLVYWFILPLWFQHFGLAVSWLDVIGESYFWFAATMSAIILGYFGFTTLPFIGRGKSSRRQNYEMYEDDY